MATPVYIVCSHSASTDKDSGLHSLFELIEKITVSELPPRKDGIILIERQKFMISSCWIIDTKNGETFDDEFEYAAKIYVENGDTIMEKSDKFKFSGPDKPGHRLVFNLLGPIPIKLRQDGVLLSEVKVRKVGSQSWKQHNYRIPVEYQKLSEL